MIKPDSNSNKWKIRVWISSAVFAFVGVPAYIMAVINGYYGNYFDTFFYLNVMVVSILFGLYFTGMIRQFYRR